jgi:AcrR family transcriptional regulator
MARRGDELREHILWSAKDVFLELGFERASMDVVAARAKTSKRSLYAHFESKEKLFLAVIELVRTLFLSKLKTPAEYSDKPAEALAMFCGRYLEMLLYKAQIQMCRVSMAETARFSEGAAMHFDVLFAEVQKRLSTYLKETFDLSPRASADASQKLLGALTYPGYLRALFGIDPLRETIGDVISPDFDLKPVRKIVADWIDTLPQR